MPAKNAIKEYHENGYYHLYNRGVNKGLIFSDDHDYKTFLYYLKLYLCSEELQVEYLKLFPSRKLKNYCDRLKLLAYSLMPNHFHLLVWQKDADAINHFMRSLIVKYAMYFNKKYKRIGPLFQGVYKAVQVENEQQLIYLSKYIHRNPIVLTSGRVLEITRGVRFGDIYEAVGRGYRRKTGFAGALRLFVPYSGGRLQGLTLKVEPDARTHRGADKRGADIARFDAGNNRV